MKYLRVIVIALMMGTLTGAVSAQTDDSGKQDRKESRRQMKADQAKKDKENFEKIKEAVTSQTFVLEANRIYGKYGSIVPVASDNFILFDKDHFVLQTANPARMGYNGLGGLTAKGQVTDYKSSYDAKNGVITVRAQVSTFGIGQGTLQLHVNKTGNGSATFTNNWGGRITFVGPVMNLKDSRVFEGMDLI